MGILFISHSSRNNDRAVEVRDWLRSEGWGEVFLDLDPSQGIAPGQRWQEELKKAGENCSAVVVLISPSWAESIWCRTEFLLADQLGKRIFPVIIEPTELDKLPIELRGKFQIADISSSEKKQSGFDALAIGLRRAGLDPKSFDWPPALEPNRCVYRGLQALDIQDAAIFFGRNAAITHGLDDLRQMRDGTPERVLVILGASGAGKSSFLRAGLIARLRRDEENFIPLPIIRPERAILRGAQGFLSAVARALQSDDALVTSDSIVAAFDRLRAPIVDRLARTADAARETYTAKAPTIVIPIDQAEEMYATENTEHVEFMVLLTEVLKKDPNTVVVLTIRSDSYAPLQSEQLLSNFQQRLFNLGPLPSAAFQEIIEGPARLAKPPFSVEPALSHQLLSEVTAGDALPLLAFTLERLLKATPHAATLTLDDYTRNLGGIAGAIRSAVAAALEDITPKTLALARSLFIPALVAVDAEGAKRRVALFSDLPSEAASFAARFINQRMLVTNVRRVDGRDVTTIEVAHEAILRQWPTLAGWISEDRESLQALDGLRAAAREWSTQRDERRRGADVWLVHRGERLRTAVRIAERDDFERVISRQMSEYLIACQRAERRASGDKRGLEALALISVIGLAGLAYLALGGGGEAIYRYWWFGRHVQSDAQLRGRTALSFEDCAPRSRRCPTMVVIGSGSFVMGAAPSDTNAYSNESPTIEPSMEPFAISAREITVGEWGACVSARRCPQVDAGASSNQPVVNVSWNDAQVYVRWLSDMTGREYRLPTEAEWEYAARGRRRGTSSTTERFAWGDSDPTCDFESEGGASFKGCGLTGPTDVGSFAANRFGLYDVHGNVWEWADDCYSDHPRRNIMRTDDSETTCVTGVIRGGSWFDAPRDLRSARRVALDRGSRNVNIGFRVVRTLDGGLS